MFEPVTFEDPDCVELARLRLGGDLPDTRAQASWFLRRRNACRMNVRDGGGRFAKRFARCVCLHDPTRSGRSGPKMDRANVEVREAQAARSQVEGDQGRPHPVGLDRRSEALGSGSTPARFPGTVAWKPDTPS